MVPSPKAQGTQTWKWPFVRMLFPPLSMFLKMLFLQEMKRPESNGFFLSFVFYILAWQNKKLAKPWLPGDLRDFCGSGSLPSTKQKCPVQEGATPSETSSKGHTLIENKPALCLTGRVAARCGDSTVASAGT